MTTPTSRTFVRTSNRKPTSATSTRRSPKESEQPPEQEAYADGKEPGHLGNDTSGMTLLNTDLEALAKEEHEPNPEIRQALDELHEIPVRQIIEESDG